MSLPSVLESCQRWLFESGNPSLTRRAMIELLHRFTSLLAVVALIVATSVARAEASEVQQNTNVIRHVDVGFAGYFKLGKWLPLFIELGTTDADQLCATTIDGDGERVEYCLDLSDDPRRNAQPTRRLHHYVKIGRRDAPLTVQLRKAGQIIASYSVGHDDMKPVSSTSRLLVTLGRSMGMEQARSYIAQQRNQEVVAVTMTRLELLPPRWFGFEGVDAIGIPTSDESLQLSGQVADAIDLWCRMGGHLIVSAASNGEAIAAENSQMRRWIPGQFVGVKPVRSAAALMAYADAREPIAIVAKANRRPEIDMMLLRDIDGRIEAFSASGLPEESPMIIRRPYGLGTSAFVAFDLEDEPFASWSGRGRLLSRLIDHNIRARVVAKQQEVGGQMAQVGYRDLSGQLRAAMEQYDNVAYTRFSWLVGLTILLIAMIGPVEYFALKRAGPTKMWLTWITFPIVIVLFTCGAIWMKQTLKGDQLKANQIDLVDVDQQTGLTRATTWLHVYTPRTTSVAIGLDATGFGDGMDGHLLSWHGLPGAGLGGMETSTGTSLFDVSYQINQDDQQRTTTIQAMPIPTCGSKSLTTLSWQDASAARESATSALVADGKYVKGKLVNPLSVTLTDCMLLYDRNSVRIDRPLRPNDSIEMSAYRNATKNFASQLMRSETVSKENVANVNQEWNPESLNTHQILQMMMFHDVAGGAAYTHMEHYYLTNVDITEQLRLGRAILVGRSDVPATNVQFDDERLPTNAGKRQTIYRIVLPVAREPND